MATFLRAWWVAALLGPATILASVDATAASRLPRRVHLGSDGRYYENICDPLAPRHCFSSRVLPEGYVPPEMTPAAVPEAQQTLCTQTSSAPGTATAPAAGAMGPTEVQAAYALPTTTAGHGRIVALLDMPDATAFDDLTKYRAGYGLPALPKCPNGVPDGITPCFAAVDEDGNTNPTIKDCIGADPETSLDMDMVSAACEDCSILLVQLTGASASENPTDNDFLTGAATAAKLGAVVTSISFGGSEGGVGSPDPSGYTTPGHLVVAASGDAGYLMEGIVAQTPGLTPTPSYPASSPDVLSIGGTFLQFAQGQYGETVWNDPFGAAGSGCSTEFPMPAFQTAFGATKFGTCAMRASVDLAGASNFLAAGAKSSGISEYDAYNTWIEVEGTSAAAPLIAAILVRLEVADAISRDFGFVYKHPEAFNDILQGTNDGFDKQTLCKSGDALQCTAGAGWDGPTGLGTPNGPKLAALGSTTSSVPDAGSLTDSGTPGGDGGRPGGVTTGYGSGVSSSSGCSCAVPGSPCPLGSTEALLALGALAIVGGRRKRR